MRIALFGYGKMGRMIEAEASQKGHEVCCIIDPAGGSRGRLSDSEVAVDFSEPSAVINNIGLACSSHIPIVVGTTGWYDQVEDIRRKVEESGSALVYGSNFSIGVNLMFRIAQEAARMFSQFDSYDPYIEEAHHKFKKDAPSGTAVFLKRFVESEYRRDVPTSSIRAGFFPGQHIVGFDSETDTLAITHTARSRAGFAAGAVLAAQWITGKQGFYEFSQIIDDIFGKRVGA